MEMTKANKQRLIFGPIVLLVGVVLLIFWKNPPSIIISGLIAAGFATTINGIYSHSKYGVQAEFDERTRKISASAVTYSWFISLTFVGVLGFLNSFGLLEMTVAKVLSIIILVMIGTLILFYAYFVRKGGVE
jgi:putative flippase GtrA